MAMLSSEIESYLDKGSWIRRIFESGIEMKKKYGEDGVCDFSLGNPDLPAPDCVAEALRELACKACEPYALGYMPNAGHPHVRAALAEYLGKEQGVELEGSDVIITAGAAAGLNVLFRAVLNPGEEVLCPAPYFVEYGFYVANSGGRLKPVQMQGPEFALDVKALKRAITKKTRIILFNSPNNPTGQVYSGHEISQLCEMVAEANLGRERPILLAADEPYRFLTYAGLEVPQVLSASPYAVLVSSFSKNLSLAGERVGYLAVSPRMPGKAELLAGLVFASRILGYVNAPVIGQEILLKALGSQVDSSVYVGRRNLMCGILHEAGYEFSEPKGAFYIFPKAPGGDCVRFVGILREERILAVPGSGFGTPGYFRLHFCVGEEVIARSAEGFKKALARA